MVRPLVCAARSAPGSSSVIAPPKLLPAPISPLPVNPVSVRITPRRADGEAARRPVHLHMAGAGSDPRTGSSRRASGPAQSRARLALAARCAVANVVPPAIFVHREVVFSVRSPLTVTPLNRLLGLHAITECRAVGKAERAAVDRPTIEVPRSRRAVERQRAAGVGQRAREIDRHHPFARPACPDSASRTCRRRFSVAVASA